MNVWEGKLPVSTQHFTAVAQQQNWNVDVLWLKQRWGAEALPDTLPRYHLQSFFLEQLGLRINQSTQKKNFKPGGSAEGI